MHAVMTHRMMALTDIRVRATELVHASVYCLGNDVIECCTLL